MSSLRKPLFISVAMCILFALTLKEKLPYYIVSKDGQKFGAYNTNGKMVLQMKYSLAQIEEKIDKKQFRRR